MIFKKSLGHYWRVSGLVCAVLLVVLAACPTDSNEGPSGAKSITSFKVGDTIGDIQESVILVYLPRGTEVASLSPTIAVSEGATVSPASGTARDFSGPQVYQVTAADGSVKTYSVRVSMVTLSSISIGQSPYKTSYLKDEELDLEGLVVTGEYSDGSTQFETVTEEDLSNYNPAIAGSQNVFVTIDGKSAYFTVNVADPVEVTLVSITLEVEPYKTTYLKGEELDLEGLVVTGEYSDGSIQFETVTETDLRNYKKDIVGSQRVFIAIGGRVASFYVTVIDVSPLELSVQVGSDRKLAIYGIPSGGLKLAKENAPQSITVRVGGGWWSGINWYVDNQIIGSNESVTVSVNTNSGLTVGQPHWITFTGTQDGVRYSERISFEVTW